MQVTIGSKGLKKSHQDEFPPTTSCCRCAGIARIAFVAHEGFGQQPPYEKTVAALHNNRGKGEYWMHDYCSVAVYFCKDCLEPTAIANQG